MGNRCRFRSLTPVIVWDGALLQLFILSNHLFSRSSSLHLLASSFPSHFWSSTLSPPTLEHEVLGYVTVNSRSSSRENVTASLAKDWCPHSLAFPSKMRTIPTAIPVNWPYALPASAPWQIKDCILICGSYPPFATMISLNRRSIFVTSARGHVWVHTKFINVDGAHSFVPFRKSTGPNDMYPLDIFLGGNL